MYLKILVFVFSALIAMVRAPMPGTFFWKPRLGLDLSVPTTEGGMVVSYPSKYNIWEGLVVFIEGYQVGMSVIALAAGISSGYTSYPHLNMLSAYYHTNAYRWGLRHLSLLPYWMSGHGGHYCDSHKVWKRRFYYMDEFMPKWLRKVFFYVKESEWDKEESEFKQYKKYAEPAFGKHFRYPKKKSAGVMFASYMTRETEENNRHSPSSSESA